MTLDVALGDELLLALHLDRKMDVWRAAGVGDRFDRAENIFSGRAGEEAPEALKVLVALVGIAGPGVKISPAVVTLPDFDERIAYRVAARVEDPPAQPGDFAHSGCNRVVQDEQVVVGVERQFVRIERDRKSVV